MTNITFLSELNRGFNALTDLSAADAQLTFSTTLTVVSHPSGEEHPINKNVGLYRPCDVLAIQPGAIYRTDPDHRLSVGEFEPNYLAVVEFAAADLPWRFTTASTSNGRKTPWLALVVLAEGEYEDAGTAGGGERSNQKPPSVLIHNPAGVLPPSAQLGAWAHAQALGLHEGASQADLDVVDKSSLTAVRSRLIAARRLRPRTRYRACLIPTFECGRTHGLDPTGQHTHTPGLAWSESSTAPLEFPVYFSWDFGTSIGGDIEALAKRIQPRPLDPSTGTRPLRIGDQEYGVQSTPGPLLFAGAVVSTEGLDPPTQPPETTEALIDVLNTPATMQAENDVALVGLAALAPPIYGQWHARQHELDPSDATSSWVSELNANLPNRSAAGLGAEVIRQHQEELVAEAWRQVGAVMRANEQICSAQLGLLVSTSAYRQSVARLDDDSLLGLARPILAKLRAAGIGTIDHELENTTLRGVPNSARMRSVVAPRSTMRRAFARESVAVDPSNFVTPLGAARSFRSGFEAGIVDPALSLSIHADFDNSAPTDEPTETANVGLLAAEIRAATRPDLTIPARINALLDGVQVASAQALCNVVMPAPEFDTPMYSPLRDLSVGHLLPGIGEIPPNTAALLESNQTFIEAYLTGLNYEMAAELLWRGYPATDLRATYFRYFWESAGEFPDIKPIHEWVQALGQNGQSGASLVLLLRGDLIQRYPGIMVYAHKATYTSEDGYELADEVANPIFRGDLTPDTIAVGFDLDESQARGFKTPSGDPLSDHETEILADPGYFFVLEEQPREARFGLDEPEKPVSSPSENVSPWQLVTWADVAPQSHVGTDAWDGPIDLSVPTRDATLPTDPPWNSSAADTAFVLFQQPYRIAIHAQRLLPAAQVGGDDS